MSSESHMLEKDFWLCNRMGLRVGISRSKGGLRTRGKTEWFRVTESSGVFPTAKSNYSPLIWSSEIPGILKAPITLRDGKGNEHTCTCTHTLQAKTETWIDTGLHSPSFLSTLFAFLGPSCVKAPEAGPRSMRENQLCASE